MGIERIYGSKCQWHSCIEDPFSCVTWHLGDTFFSPSAWLKGIFCMADSRGNGTSNVRENTISSLRWAAKWKIAFTVHPPHAVPRRQLLVCDATSDSFVSFFSRKASWVLMCFYRRSNQEFENLSQLTDLSMWLAILHYFSLIVRV